MTTAPLRLGISRCLLGEEVRFDGGHKRDNFLTEVLGRYVEWVPVCPEVEAGLGTPREAMRLVGDPQHPRLVTIKSGTDHTRALETMTTNRIDELKELDLSGYVFKKGSPSCGIERVRIYNEHGMPSRNGVGLFARAFIEQFPLIPVEEEGRLCDPTLRENFIERVFCYRRWQDLVQSGVTKQALVQFHTIHKYLLLAHQPAAIQGARTADRSGPPVPPEGTRPPVWGTVHEDVGREGDGAQACECAPAHCGAFQGTAQRSRESRAVGRDRRLSSWAHALGCSSDTDQALRPDLRCELHSGPGLSQSASEGTHVAQSCVVSMYEERSRG